ncbi:MAG: CarD family transcriptional regulator [Bdellovibrionales bacterium RIFOXYA1_FULL_36_14]|nr:MAG: CarD family transcriptional regulator [Bdellovibrionales bacterium RIFOXYA1_FULL_36_14]
MFNIGDYAVCPGHGVAQVCNIEEREVELGKKAFYVLKLISNGMTIMVPTDSDNGIRPLVNTDEVSEVYTLLKNHDVKIDNTTWNRRYREYMLKIKTGSLLEIADVLRSLFLLKTKKNLSFGEKKMLETCKDLLAQEISLSKQAEKKDIKEMIDSCFQ